MDARESGCSYDLIRGTNPELPIDILPGLNWHRPLRCIEKTIHIVC